MRQIIILTDDDLDALRNNKMVQVHSRHICPEPIYLTTQKGWEIDLKSDRDTLQVGHGCKTCKYGLKWLTEEPCSSCDIRLGNNKWEPDEKEDGDK